MNELIAPRLLDDVRHLVDSARERAAAVVNAELARCIGRSAASSAPRCYVAIIAFESAAKVQQLPYIRE